MKGHLRERSPGRWAFVIDVGEADSITRKKRRKWFSFQGTKTEAKAWSAKKAAEVESDSYIEPAKETVAEFLDRWLTHIAPSVAPKTHERYAEVCRKTIVPQLGAVVLSKLKTDRIDAALTAMLASGRRKTGEGLSPRTVHHARRILIKALNQAVTWDRLSNNPARASTPPKVERKKMLAYDTAQTAKLIEAMRPTRMLIPTLLAVMGGLRRGEIIALRWRHLDLDRRVAAIVESAEQTKKGVRYKEPKSGKARTIALSQTLAAELRAYRARQAEEQLRLGLRPGPDAFVVAQADGRPLQPVSLTHEWVRLIGKTALPRIRFHDLRHTHASQMLAAGVHPKIASERLGHSSIGITLDLYSHVMPGMQADAVEQVDAALRAAINAGSKAE